MKETVSVLSVYKIPVEYYVMDTGLSIYFLLRLLYPKDELFRTELVFGFSASVVKDD